MVDNLHCLKAFRENFPCGIGTKRVEVLLARRKSPLWPMQTVLCFRSVLLYKLWGEGKSLTSNIDTISESARGIHAEVRLWPCVN
jgi:hypothetical protein